MLVLVAAALAAEIPTFDAEQRVYVVPSGFAFSHSRVEAAARASEHDIRVVVFEAVIDGRIAPGRASETEDALEDLAAAWRASADTTGFRPDETSIVVLGLDDREVRVMSAGRWDAELGLHNDALLPIIDENFLPLARTGDLDGALAATVNGLDERIHYERFVRPQEQAAAAQRRRLMGLAGVSGLGLAGLGGLAARARGARERFGAALAERQEALSRAESTLAELTLSTETVEKVSVIRDKGPRTSAAWREVTAELDALQVGLATLRRHLDEVSAAPGAARALRAAPWEAALARLEDGVAAQPTLVQHRLFPRENSAETLQLSAFIEGLEARFAKAREGWEALVEAAELRLTPAEAAVGDLGLAALRRRIGAAGLPESWLAEHPLLPDPAAGLAQLDALRRADPLAYLEACEAHTAKVERLAAEVADLLDDRERAAAAARDAREAPGVPEGTVVSDPEEDPALALAPLDAAERALGAALMAGRDFDAVDQTAEALIAAAIELKRRKDQANTATTEAGRLLAAAEERLANLTRQSAEAEARLSAFAAQHLPTKLAEGFRELGEARMDLGQMRDAIGQARTHLEGRDFVGALKASGRAMAEHGEAVANLEELARLVSALESARADAMALMQQLDNARACQEVRLLELGLAVSALDHGDQLRAQLPPMSGPLDYAQLSLQLRAVQESWQSRTNSLVAREIERQRAAAEAARRAAQAASYQRSSSSSFGSSSFGSRSSSSSSGRSFSSGSRSAGRSFSSGGRSAGRKF